MSSIGCASIDVVWELDHWHIVHGGQVLATCASERDAKRAALAIERLRPKERTDAVGFSAAHDRVAANRGAASADTAGRDAGPATNWAGQPSSQHS